jgi:hypothetical protein
MGIDRSRLKLTGSMTGSVDPLRRGNYMRITISQQHIGQRRGISFKLQEQCCKSFEKSNMFKSKKIERGA